jgi:hypothetical protein
MKTRDTSSGNGSKAKLFAKRMAGAALPQLRQSGGFTGCIASCLGGEFT